MTTAHPSRGQPRQAPIICPQCEASLDTLLWGPARCGPGDELAFYCDQCGRPAVAGVYELARYATFSGWGAPSEASGSDRRSMEEALCPCECGGTFRFVAMPRCPHCHGSLAGLLPDESCCFRRCENGRAVNDAVRYRGESESVVAQILREYQEKPPRAGRDQSLDSPAIE